MYQLLYHFLLGPDISNYYWIKKHLLKEIGSREKKQYLYCNLLKSHFNTLIELCSLPYYQVLFYIMTLVHIYIILPNVIL